MKLRIQVITMAILGLVSAALAVEPVAEENPPPPHQRFFAAAQFNRDFDVVGLTMDGKLVSVNQMWGTLRDYDGTEGALPSLEILKDFACLVTPKEVLCVSLASGEVQRVPHTLGARVAAGFLGTSRLLAQNGSRVQIFERQTGKMVHDIALLDEPKRQGFRSIFNISPTHLVHKGHLFVALPLRGIAVVDLSQGALLKVLDVGETVTRIAATNGKVFSKNVTLSYGIVRESLQVWDLATWKPANRISLERMAGDRLRMDASKTSIGDMVVASGMLNVVIDRDVLQITAEGRLVGIAKKVIYPNERLISSGTLPFVTSHRLVNPVRFQVTTIDGDQVAAGSKSK